MPAAFLRGFFDSEGSVFRNGLRAYNTNTRILEFVREQLIALKIECSEPQLNRAGGRPAGADGKYITKKDLYAITVRPYSLELFLMKIGFSIRRKQQRLQVLVMKRRNRRRKKNGEEETVEEEVVVVVEEESVDADVSGLEAPSIPLSTKEEMSFVITPATPG
ncbi:MAG: hypothetical protein NZ988_06450 [Thaumarchaeota archaeon]|nr:hypothetical protein [Candidatus Calditenuaceae archaeon]MDW8187660.1 LAGLIDADG family homing endonuclease [Nitrososphaerota archaeon]